MVITHAQAIDAVQIVTDLADKADEDDANVLVLGTEVVKQLRKLRDAVRANTTE